MEIPSKYLNIKNIEISKTEFKSERDELVSEIVDRLTKERIGTEWEKKPVTKRAIAIMLNKKFSGNNYQLRIWLASLKEKTYFSKLFWYSIKQ